MRYKVWSEKLYLIVTHILYSIKTVKDVIDKIYLKFELFYFNNKNYLKIAKITSCKKFLYDNIYDNK